MARELIVYEIKELVRERIDPSRVSSCETFYPRPGRMQMGDENNRFCLVADCKTARNCLEGYLAKWLKWAKREKARFFSAGVTKVAGELIVPSDTEFPTPHSPFE